MIQKNQKKSNSNLEQINIDENKDIDQSHSELVETINSHATELKTMIKNCYSYSYGHNKLDKTLNVYFMIY